MGQIIRKILWVFFVGCVVVIFLRVFPWDDPNTAWQKAGDYSDQFSAWIKEMVAKFNLGDLPKPNPIELPTTSSK